MGMVRVGEGFIEGLWGKSGRQVWVRHGVRKMAAVEPAPEAKACEVDRIMD